jgi:CBS domain-containing protein
VDDGKLVGIVSRSDIVRAASLDRSLAGVALEGVEQSEFAPAESPDPVELLRTVARTIEPLTVRQIMVVDAVTVSSDTPVRQVSRILTDRHLHRVLVTEGQARASVALHGRPDIGYRPAIMVCLADAAHATMPRRRNMYLNTT